ncbi:MAG: type II toxin-antitoxin system HipA family toxin [Oligoflexia bacterium]|nr:type II toxin-antitoxin system HipA family toxin [Oligoflexia bacterium]
MKNPLKDLYVYIFLKNTWVACGLIEYLEKGRFSSSIFRYGKKYLERSDAISIDPVALPLSDESFFTEEGMYLFNGIRDSGPDKWGRYLLDKKFKRSLSEIEYVASIGADRVGALAFGPDHFSGPKQYTPSGFKEISSTIKRISLATCLGAIDDAFKEEESKRLRLYLEYGPSLGGARPKTTVDWKQGIYLAKFSLSFDSKNEPLIEYATMKMAQKCGLNVPKIDITKIGRRDVFLIERFDRDKNGRPIPFLSGLGITGLAENDYSKWSYLKLCEAIRKYCYNPKDDLKELFSRMVYNICVYNNDDHLRNFAFLYHKNNKWKLSPLYDVIPGIINSNTYALAMELGEYGKDASIKNALSSCEQFDLSKNKAKEICDKISEIVAKWEKYFSKLGVNKKDLKMLQNSFVLKS